MKVVAAALLALALPSLTCAWTFVDGYGHTFSGSNNRDCTGSDTKAEETFDWDVGFFEDCCIHLYEDAACDSEVGFSCDDWKKAASKNLNSFRVTNC